MADDLLAKAERVSADLRGTIAALFAARVELARAADAATRREAERIECLLLAYRYRLAGVLPEESASSS